MWRERTELRILECGNEAPSTTMALRKFTPGKISYSVKHLKKYINNSSIGMAKSALEAINGCNLFGDKGASWSVVYVDIDAHNRNRSIFETLLPRESSSKVMINFFNL